MKQQLSYNLQITNTKFRIAKNEHLGFKNENPKPFWNLKLKIGTFLIFWNLLFGISNLCAQTALQNLISLNEAVDMAVARYPKIKSAQLKIEQQEALKKTAVDLGNTYLFTSGEELGGNAPGVYTSIGIQQQNIAIFDIGPRLQLQKQRIALAQSALALNIVELEQQVRLSYGEAYVAKQNLQLFQQMDSVYGDFERAAKLRYEVEETSKLEYLAAANQAKQVELQKKQATQDYLSALQKLNLWLVSDTLFAPENTANPDWLKPLLLIDSIENHPALQLSENKINIAKAKIKTARAGYLPKLTGQYGLQQVGGEPGFFQYQLGISIPLFFLPQRGRVQAAQIQEEINIQDYRQVVLELKNQYRALWQQYRKWLISWEYYRQEALPLAREQRAGAVFAFKEGAINYVTFIQNLKETLQIEIKAQEALNNYLQNKFEIQYFLTPLNNNTNENQ